MKNLFLPEIDRHRIYIPKMGHHGNEHCGAFMIPHPPTGVTLRAVVSSAALPGSPPWDHVSVSLKNRCPNWPEMCFVKDFFFEPEDWCAQFHPAHSEYVNDHEYCLHIWRFTGILPTPPSFMVGLKPGQTQEQVEEDIRQGLRA